MNYMTIRNLKHIFICHEHTNKSSFFCLKIMIELDLNREYSCIRGKKIKHSSAKRIVKKLNVFNSEKYKK